MELLQARPDVQGEAYLKQRLAASAKANAEQHFTQVDKESKVQRHDALNRSNDVTRVEKHKKISKAEFEGSKQELESKLFQMFEERERWKLKEVAVCIPFFFARLH